MQHISTLLVEKNSFLREGLKSLLTQSNYDPISEVRCVREAPLKEGEQEFNLIIQGIEGIHDDIPDRVAYLKTRFPYARIVILSPVLDSGMIKESFSAGADGFILKDISGKAFLGSLNLIMLGEKVFPTSMATLLTRSWESWSQSNSIHGANDYHLSGRELEIIQCLARGDTNKEIARTLTITESTVKVHLKTILRKLKLSNRTQAAIWAVSKGVVPYPEITPANESKPGRRKEGLKHNLVEGIY